MTSANRESQASKLTITTTIAGSTVTYTATTNSLGAYSVAGLPLGDFTVAVVTATLPAGVSQTFDSNGIATPNASAVSLTLAAATDTAQDFGYSGAGAIGDLVWNDLDGDGVRDAGEPGLPGVTVTATITIGSSDVTYTTTTASDGSYSFIRFAARRL